MGIVSEIPVCGADMPIPIFASCPELEIAIGKVGLCCECSREHRPAAAPLYPTPVPAPVGGLNAPSDDGPVPARRADRGVFEDMCDVGGGDDEDPKEDVEE